MTYAITPLTAHRTGAEVRGLDLRKPLSDRVRLELNTAFATHHVLVIRDQVLKAGDFARAAENFGEIMPQHIKETVSPEHPGVCELKPIEVAPGQYQVPGESFHTDHSWDPHPPKATALYPVRLPAKGGDTQFVNMHLAYDELAPATRERIAGLQGLHKYQNKNATRQVRALDQESLDALPKTLHPLVRVHPENGRRFLFINPVRMESIAGMDDAEALKLVDELMAHATQSKYEYRHVWRQGDMVIWDNRSVLHQANGDYDMREGRHMYRLMLVG